MSRPEFPSPLRLLHATVAAAALAVIPAVSQAATLTLDAGIVDPQGHTHIGSVNLGAHRNVVIRWRAQDTTLDGPSAGSLALTTYVDPLLPIGFGAMTANFVPRAVETPLDDVTLTAQWGDTLHVVTDFTPLGDGVQQGTASLGTTFTQGGPAGSQELVFSWSGLDPTKGNQFVASVAAIPLPAAGWLLLTALGGLAIAGRRRKGEGGA